MTDYSSVKNTAKNGKLIRAEIREYVLAMTLIHGFYRDDKAATELYQGNMHRVKQCVFSRIHPVDEKWVLRRINDETLALLQTDLVRTIKQFFKYWNEKNHVTVFYDTKKLRIYYNRLRYGREHKVNLKKTMQYMWTPALLTCMMAQNYHKKYNRLDLSGMWFYDCAYNQWETVDFILKYLSEVCKLKTKLAYNPDQHCIYAEDMQELIDLAITNAAFIKSKLIEGKYLQEEIHQYSYNYIVRNKMGESRWPAKKTKKKK